MDQEVNESLGWEPFVGRGLVGGGLSGLSVGLGVGVYATFLIESDHLAMTMFVPPLFGAVAGVIEGLVIGYIIFWWSHRRQKVPNALTRFLIGSSCLFLYLLLTDLVSKGTAHYFFDLGNAIPVGGAAGFVARPRKLLTSIQHRTEHALGADSPVSNFYR
jgi:hypothetical protein